MGDYRPVLYLRTLNRDCSRLRRVLEELDADVELRDVLTSLRSRRAFAALGDRRLPCLVLGNTVVDECEEIVKYLRLRYGRGEAER